MNSKYQNTSPIHSNYNNIDIYRNNLHYSSDIQKKNQKKLSFKSLKNNTLSSLNEVEHFLNNFQNAIKYIKLYKLFK